MASHLRPLNTVSAIIFDLDDTLIDSSRGRLIAELRVSHMLAHHLLGLGETLDPRTVASKLSDLSREMNRRYLYDRSIWWKSLVDRLGFTLKLPYKIISEMTREYWSCYGEWSLPFPDTASTLESLIGCGYRLGLVTDTDGTPRIKEWRLSLLPFRRAFSVIVIAGEDTSKTKPDVAPFRLAASSLGLPPSECIFVGDKPFTDIKGAGDAGMMTALLERGIWEPCSDPDFIVTSLSGLTKIL